jgi:hypothetical protein
MFVTQDAGLEQVGKLRLVAVKQKTEVKTGVKRTFYAYEAA